MPFPLLMVAVVARSVPAGKVPLGPLWKPEKMSYSSGTAGERKVPVRESVAGAVIAPASDAFEGG